MKRKREVEKKTEIRSAIEELSMLINLKSGTKNNKNINGNDNHNDNNNDSKPKSPAAVVAAATAAGIGVGAPGKEDDNLQQQIKQNFNVSTIHTRPFLSICSLILQVLDKIGPTMAVMRQDIYKNIQRLEMLYNSDPTIYCNLVEVLKKEAVERNAKKGDSCSKALVWLIRSLDFTAALLQRLAAEPKESMELIVENCYQTTLKPWHGWISAAAYRVALKLVPETDTLISLLMEKYEGIDSFNDEVQVFISLLTPLLEDLHSTLSSYGLEKLKST